MGEKLPEDRDDETVLLGRDGSYNVWRVHVMDRWRVVQSSNVYGYYDETAITPQRRGIVYVTFLGGQG